jgi:cardiolipin synthase
VRCFEWRDDETGQMVAAALLRAADRGVEIKILKDRVGMAYEHLEGTKQSFFHKRIGLIPRLQTWSLMTVYGRWGSLRQKPSPLADALLNHQMVTSATAEALRPREAVRVRRRDRDPGRHGHRRRLPPPQRRLHGRDLGRRRGGAARRSLRGRAAFDPERAFDYLLHSFKGAPRSKVKRDSGSRCAKQRLALIASAQKRLTNRDGATSATAPARRRWSTRSSAACPVTVLTGGAREHHRRPEPVDVRAAPQADRAARTTCASCSTRAWSTARRIVGDGAWVDIGSTNFTSPSHGGYEEVDLFCRDVAFAKRVEDAIEHDIRDGKPAKLPIRYRRPYVRDRAYARSCHGARRSRRSEGGQ